MRILEPTSHSVCCCGDNTTTRIVVLYTIKVEETMARQLKVRDKVPVIVALYSERLCPLKT